MDDGRLETFGQRYVFARVDRSEVATRVGVNSTFTPSLTLETDAEPFASSESFSGFGELLAPRSRELLEYGTASTTIARNADGSRTVAAGGQRFEIDNVDSNVRSLRSNVVLRWEWRPGSVLFLFWQQDQEASRPFGTERPRDLWDALSTSGDSFFAVRSAAGSR